MRIGDVIEYEYHMGVVVCWVHEYNCPGINWIVPTPESPYLCKGPDHQLADFYPTENTCKQIKIIGHLPEVSEHAS